MSNELFKNVRSLQPKTNLELKIIPCLVKFFDLIRIRFSIV